MTIEWNRANPEKVREINARFRANHPELRKEQAKRWYHANKERAKAARAAYCAKNPEKIAALKTSWAQKNRPKTRAASKRFVLNHPDRRQASLAIRRARKRGVAINDFTAAQWRLLKSIFGNRCAYCLQGSDRIHMEHVRPISRGGSHTLTNIVPACEPCNLKKAAKVWKPLLKFGF